MNIYQKLIEVRKEVPYIQKADKGHQYNYTGSSRVLGSLKAKMDELGLLLIPRIISKELHQHTEEKNGKSVTTYFTELNMEFTWVNAEKPEEQIVCPWYGQGIDTAGEKGVGKALTYSEKYFMLKFFNIATDKDDPDTFQKQFEEEKPKANGKQIGEIKVLVEKLVGVGVSKVDSFNLMKLECGKFSKLDELNSDQATRAIQQLGNLLAQNEQKGA